MTGNVAYVADRSKSATASRNHISAAHGALIPESWQPGEPLLEAVAGTYEQAAITAGQEGAAEWYYRAQPIKATGAKK